MIGSPFVDLVIRTILIISITDAVIFYWLSKHPKRLTLWFVIEVIIVTIIPLIISLWFVLIFKQG